MDGQLLEIVVQGSKDKPPAAVARHLAQRMALPNGVQVTVVASLGVGRPRRFVVHDGGVTSTQQHAAARLTEALEAVLRTATQPLDEWELLLAIRQLETVPGHATLATIHRAALLLMREGRVLRGAKAGTWIAECAERATA